MRVALGVGNRPELTWEHFGVPRRTVYRGTLSAASDDLRDDARVGIDLTPPSASLVDEPGSFTSLVTSRDGDRASLLGPSSDRRERAPAGAECR